jgi:branched-chain amino acid transport system ATP-binding protein
MADPKLLLLDEPSMGLSPILVKEIFEIIKKIHKQGTSMLLVEQNATLALKFAKRGYVLETGKVVIHDNCDALKKDERVKKAYLGG